MSLSTNSINPYKKNSRNIVPASNSNIPTPTEVGELIVSNNSNSYSLLAPGADYTVLTSLSSAPDGMYWGTSVPTFGVNTLNTFSGSTIIINSTGTTEVYNLSATSAVNTNTIEPYSTSGVSVVDGLYLPTTGGTPALLSNYEVWTGTAVASGPWPTSSNPTLNIRIVCIGKCCTFEWTTTTLLEEQSGSANTPVNIHGGSIPTRFYPGLTSTGLDYVVGACAMLDTNWASNSFAMGQVQMDGGGTVAWIPPVLWTGTISASAILYAGYASWITS
jgi:hypothetical protein